MSTTDDQLRQLDERAATAAGDLHARAATRPAPPFDPDHATMTPLPVARPVGRGRSLAVAAMVLVIAAIAGLLVSRSGHHDDDKAKVISTDPRPFVAGDLPQGFSLAGAGQVDATAGRHGGETSPVEAGPTELYGPDPTNPTLAIASYAGWDLGPTSEEDGPKEVELSDGRTAYRYDAMGLGKHALFVVDGDRATIIVTSADDAPWIEDLGAAVTAAIDGSIDLHGYDLPGGWKPIGEGPDLISLITPMIGTSATDPGHYVLYWRDAGQTVESSNANTDAGSGESSSTEPTAPDPTLPDSASISISSTQGSEADLYATRLVADTTEATTVRGHDALIGTLDLDDGGDPLQSVTWLERPGELIRVPGSGIDEAALLAAAEDIRPADPAEWKDLVERSQLGEFDPANADEQGVTVGEGRFPDGNRWRLIANPSDDPAYPDPSVNLSVAVVGGGDSSSSSGGGTGSEMDGSEAAIIDFESTLTDGTTYAAALLRPEVARVEVRDDAGKVVATPDIVEGGGYRGVAVAIPSDTAVLVALAEDGTELDRRNVDFELEEDGSPSVSFGSSNTTTVTEPGSGSSSTSGSSIDSGSSSESGG